MLCGSALNEGAEEVVIAEHDVFNGVLQLMYTAYIYLSNGSSLHLNCKIGRA